jgi:hypothetical protein
MPQNNDEAQAEWLLVRKDMGLFTIEGVAGV